jgi:hypothetical protein
LTSAKFADVGEAVAESTLTLTMNDLYGEVGVFLGWGRGTYFGDPAWSTQQTNVLNSCVRSGLRQFYHPPPLPGEKSSYYWSFLRPIGTFDFPVNHKLIQLPEDFGSPEGDITCLSSITQVTWPIQITGIGKILQNYQVTPTTVGRPLLAATTPIKGTTPTAGTRWQLWMYPITDQDYQIQMCYNINPEILTTANPYTLGGMQHSETFLESCLTIAEERMDDAPSTHKAKFMERLAASISTDRRLKPELVGYNRDRSDQTGAWDRSLLHWLSSVTYNGEVL